MPLNRLISAVLFASLLTSACSRGPSAAGGGPPAIPVEVQEVKTSTVQNSSEFVGALEARRRVALRPETEGRLVEIFVSPGDTVQAGTPIAELKADRRQAEVSGATADVQAATAARTSAEARVRSAQAERERAKADVELQNEEFRRTQSLVSAGAQSQQALDRVTNARNTAVASLRAAEEEIKAATASLAEAQAQLSRTQADRAAARSDLQDNRIVAPIAGVVGNIPVKIGDYVNTDDTITSIIQNQTLDLNLSVPVERSTQLRIGLPVQLLDEQSEPLITGQVSFVSPEVDTTAQAVLAKASFPNNGRLRDGQFVRARVIWQSRSGVVIPTAAVTRIAGEPFVFVAAPAPPSSQADAANAAQPQQIAQQRAVKLGSIQGNDYQVLSGVEAGDQIIISGILNLSDGAAIVTEAPK